MKIKLGISNKHAHLTQEQIEALFGCGYKLTFLRNFGQPDEYVSNEKIDIIGPKGRINNVRMD